MCRICKLAEYGEPNLPNQTNQTKPTKPSLPNQTHPTKPTPGSVVPLAMFLYKITLSAIHIDNIGCLYGVYIYFCHAEIFKSGYFMQIYSNQSVLCRNIGQVPLRVTQSCAADYLDRTKPNQTPPECPAAMKRQVTL